MKIFGLLSAMSHLLLFICVYLTSLNKLSSEDFTLSSAFQYSNKGVSISLMLLTTFLILTFLYREKYLEDVKLKILFAVIFFIWILFFNEHENHSFFALIGLVVILLISYIVCKKNGGNDLDDIFKICLYFIIFLCFLSTCEYYSDQKEYFRFLFSCVEIVIVFLYFIYLYVLSNY